ncbi:hypothetical protein EON64_03350 [archaeon]|nr:MAG: hypothetical protein EON64_03350 [archaeon]
MSSTKKKHWCILLDKTLYIYNVVRDNIQLKFVYDIKSAYVQLLSNDVFRVKFSTETLYFLSLTKREHETWFRKIYSQSLSHMSVPYHVYVKKRLPARMSFTTKAMVGSQDGAMSSSQGVVKKSSAVNLSVNTNLPVSTSYSYMLEDKPFVPISPTRSTPARRRTSMEEVELMSTEVDAFLERMSQQYLQLKASNIPKLGAISKRQAAASPRRQVPSSSHRAVSVPKNVGTSVQSFVNTVNIGGTMGLGVGVDVGGNEGDFKEYISKHREESLYTPLIKEVNSEAQAAVEIGKLDRKASTVGRKERATMLDNFAATIINSRNIFM